MAAALSERSIASLAQKQEKQWSPLWKKLKTITKIGWRLKIWWSLEISNLLMEFQTKLNGKPLPSEEKWYEGSLTFQIIKVLKIFNFEVPFFFHFFFHVHAPQAIFPARHGTEKWKYSTKTFGAGGWGEYFFPLLKAWLSQKRGLLYHKLCLGAYHRKQFDYYFFLIWKEKELCFLKKSRSIKKFHFFNKKVAF